MGLVRRYRCRSFGQRVRPPAGPATDADDSQQCQSRCPAQSAQASGRGRCDAGPRAMKAALPACATIGMVLFAACANAASDDATARAQALVAKLTLKEKVAQLQDSAHAIPRFGVSAYTWWNEGLHGLARGGFATVFPQ